MHLSSGWSLFIFIPMVREAFEVFVNVWVLHDIMTCKGFHGVHAKEAEVRMHGQP